MTGLDLSIVIVSWNTRDLTLACLRALQHDESTCRREIILVDNGSDDGTADAIAEEFREVVLVRNAENRLYSEGNNQGARRATGRYLCLLNSDTEVRPLALDRMLAFLESHPDYGAVGPKLLNVDGSVQRACMRFPGLIQPLLDCLPLGGFPPGSWIMNRYEMTDFDHEGSRDVEQPPGTCLMMRRVEYTAMRGLDPILSLYFNDIDLCRRLWKRGRRIRFLAEAEVFHHRGASTEHYLARNGNAIWFRNRAFYYRKHYGRLGELWVRWTLHIWAWQIGIRIRLGPRDASAKRVALDELRAHMRECLAPAETSARV